MGVVKQADVSHNPRTDHQKGSWAPTEGGNVKEGGRIMATALSLLLLELPAQKLPLFQRDKEEK
jgi:hypothetical protein